MYSAALKTLDGVLEISPDNADALASKAEIYQAECNLPAAAKLLAQIHPDPASELFYLQIQQWIYQRRYSEAIEVLKKATAGHDLPLTDWQKVNYNYNLALLQQFSGDLASAAVTWRQIQTDADTLQHSKGKDVSFFVAYAYAALGDMTKALAVLAHHEASFPSKDVLLATFYTEVRAEMAALAGDKDLAFEQLALSAQNPVGVRYGDLKLNPLWDALRGDPRFEKIVASLAPK
jgi:tetratricopeptide (TPR) repeat protein